MKGKAVSVWTLTEEGKRAYAALGASLLLEELVEIEQLCADAMNAVLSDDSEGVSLNTGRARGVLMALIEAGRRFREELNE